MTLGTVAAREPRRSRGSEFESTAIWGATPCMTYGTSQQLGVGLLVTFVFGATAPPTPQWAMTSSFTRFLDHTQGRTTVGRTPLDE